MSPCFTYEVEIPELTNIPCDLNKDDDLEQPMTHGSNDDMEYDPSDVEFIEWLASIKHRFVVKMMLLENLDRTNVFDFETPTCKDFKEFNYLLQVDPDVLTNDIEGFKTYDEYKDE
ncbi:hypothetical protein Tco_1204210 [Tanacetum coccineum]